MKENIRNILKSIPILGHLINWYINVKRPGYGIFVSYKLHQEYLKSNEFIQAQRVKKWFEDEGDSTLRLNYELDQDSVVFDVGGYKGEFADDIYQKYGSKIFIFEPLSSFFDIIKLKFSGNENIKAYHYGLSDKTTEMLISVADNSTSIFLETDEKQLIQLKDINEFLTENGIREVDLIKINIEGGEYSLLEALVESGNITAFKNIQVQFHDFIIPDALYKMNKIKSQLSITHVPTYQYEFVWENWKLKR